MEKKARLAKLWADWAALATAMAFVGVFYTLMVRKHQAFHTFALDLAKFDQAIWNTLQGRFLFSTLQNSSILANHFSPFMAMLSPLFVIWDDVRILFFAQTVGLAIAGLLLYLILRAGHPVIAPLFLLAFYLNPALHEVALVEFRRVTLAVPFLALGLYALYTRKRWLMVLGLALALLCKEDIALLVFMIGFYLLLFERDWKWGLPLMGVGTAWAIGITFWVVGLFRAQGGGPALYPQMNYFGLSGDSYGEMARRLLADPLMLFRRMFDRPGLRALWRVFLPLGLVLPLLAPGWLLIVLPSMTYMLMSSARGMHRLEDWYMASILPGLFAAIAVGVARLPARWALVALSVLLCTTVLGYGLFSHAPLGGLYDSALYTVTAHHRLAAQVVERIPSDARVAAQDPYVPHLSHREHIYLYPWIATGQEDIEYFLLDRHLNAYPLQPPKMNSAIDDMIADTSYVIEAEADGIYLFRRGDPLPSNPVGRVYGGTMLLDRVEVAVRDESGFYRTTIGEPAELRPGQEIRVSLYWEALDAPKLERTVSVRLAFDGGPLLAVQDNLPAFGKKPTSWWEKGWKIRDVYYLTVPPEAPLGRATLDVLLYDSHSLEPVPADDGADVVHLRTVDLVSW